MGAHPSAPSGVGWTTLDEVIAVAPERALGVGCAGRFGGRLPFLLKVLSAEKALSIQVHPSRAQARAGYAAENARGLAADDPARNYVDDWPKPELLYALTPFEVAAGLRTPSDAAALLRALEVDELAPLAAGLTDPGADPGAESRGRSRGLSRGRARRGPGVARPPPSRRLGRGRLPPAGGGRRPLRGRLRRGPPGRRRSSGRHRRGRAAADAVRDPAARPGGVHAGRRPARLPARHRHRTARQLRQRGPLGPHQQAHRRARTPQAPRPLGRGPRALPAPPRGRPRHLRHPRPRIPPLPNRPPCLSLARRPRPRPRPPRPRRPPRPAPLRPVPRSPCPAPAPASCSAWTAPAPCAPKSARSST